MINFVYVTEQGVVAGVAINEASINVSEYLIVEKQYLPVEPIESWVIENGEIKVSGDTQDIFLENPKPLQNLIGRKEILPLKENTVLKISFVSGEDTAVLSCISRDLKIEFSILSADIDDYNDKTTGNIFISFKSENRELVKNYLIEKKVIFNEYFDIKGGES